MAGSKCRPDENETDGLFFISGDKAMKVRIMGHVVCYAYYMGYTTHQERSKNETDAGSITASGRQNGPGK